MNNELAINIPLSKCCGNPIIYLRPCDNCPMREANECESEPLSKCSSCGTMQ